MATVTLDQIRACILHRMAALDTESNEQIRRFLADRGVRNLIRRAARNRRAEAELLEDERARLAGTFGDHPALSALAATAQGATRRAMAAEEGLRTVAVAQKVRSGDHVVVGSVKDDDGNPIGGAHLELSARGATTEQAKTAVDGAFFIRFPKEQAGREAPRFNLRVTAADGTVLAEGATLVRPEAMVATLIDIRVRAARTAVTERGPAKGTSEKVAKVKKKPAPPGARIKKPPGRGRS
jgi:hypothetical protein